MQAWHASSHGARIEYSPAFVSLVEDLTADKRDWPNYRQYIRDHLGGSDSRCAKFERETLPEIEFYCASRPKRRALDLGCGTGAATVALARIFGSVIAFDTDRRRVAICEQRCHEHGVSKRVRHACAGDIEDVAAELGRFDFVLMNGVIEHIPRSLGNLRARVLRAAFRALQPGGLLFINDTPNRLSPVDLHTTQLWWIPWTRAGSRWAFSRALRKGRYFECSSLSAGALGLEEAGAWGATYWEIRRYLGSGARCLNLTRGYDRHIRHRPASANWKRDAFEAVMHLIGVKLLKAPITSFAQDLTNLVFEKRPDRLAADRRP